MSDETRRRILERRAAFIAAFASATATACDRPQPCLSAVPTEVYKPSPPDAAVVESEVGPAVCLSESPAVCLSPPLPPIVDAGRPHPCLSKPAPKP